jgi:hypothetical protein
MYEYSTRRVKQVHWEDNSSNLHCNTGRPSSRLLSLEAFVQLQEVEWIRSIMKWRNLKQIVFLLMSQYKFYDSRFNGQEPSRKRQLDQRDHLKQSLSPTTIVLSPGGITLVLPFFYSFRSYGTQLFVYLRDRRSWSDRTSTPQTRLAGGRQASATIPRLA